MGPQVNYLETIYVKLQGNKNGESPRVCLFSCFNCLRPPTIEETFEHHGISIYIYIYNRFQPLGWKSWKQSYCVGFNAGMKNNNTHIRKGFFIANRAAKTQTNSSKLRPGDFWVYGRKPSRLSEFHSCLVPKVYFFNLLRNSTNPGNTHDFEDFENTFFQFRQITDNCFRCQSW